MTLEGGRCRSWPANNVFTGNDAFRARQVTLVLFFDRDSMKRAGTTDHYHDSENHLKLLA
jgi:hypothetical protein